MLKHWTVEELLDNGISIAMGDRIQVDVNDPYALIEINEEEGVDAWNEVGHEDNPNCVVIHFADRYGAMPEGTKIPLLVNEESGSWKPVLVRVSLPNIPEVKKKEWVPLEETPIQSVPETKLLVGVHEKPVEVTIVFEDSQGALVMFANGERTYISVDDPIAKLIKKVDSEREVLLRKLLTECTEKSISPKDLADYLISNGLFEDL